MHRPRRIHRLPQRLDYTLIPAPLDLSLPLASEKSPLPAIIVTPSSPSSNHDFSIAFLAPPIKPTLRERFSAYTKQGSLPFRARTLLFLFLLVFILLCHLVSHGMASRRPYLEFNVQEGEQRVFGSLANIFDFNGFWGSSPDVKREFVISDVE